VAGDRWHSLPRPCDRLVDGISKRNHRVQFAGHGARPSRCLSIWAERLHPDRPDRIALSRCLPRLPSVKLCSPASSRTHAVRPHLGIGGRTPRQRLAVILAALTLSPTSWGTTPSAREGVQLEPLLRHLRNARTPRSGTSSRQEGVKETTLGSTPGRDRLNGPVRGGGVLTERIRGDRVVLPAAAPRRTGLRGRHLACPQ